MFSNQRQTVSAITPLQPDIVRANKLLAENESLEADTVSRLEIARRAKCESSTARSNSTARAFRCRVGN